MGANGANTWTWPLVLSFVEVCGLLGALVTDGKPATLFAATGLGLPLLVLVWMAGRSLLRPRP